MNLYMIGILFFILVIIVCILLWIYYTKDELKLKEVSQEQLIKQGKTYQKEEFEEVIFQQYANILMNVEYENYSFLRDAVSDHIYNQILLKVKENNENKKLNKIKDIKKEFCKLISLEEYQNLEVARFWIRYSSIEYVTQKQKERNENGVEEIVEKTIQGSENTPMDHEYIITFVKDKQEPEEVLCPSCGYQTHILISSHCIRCDSEIVPKSKHWVFVEKKFVNVNKKK